jgi:hypothetical protein
MRRCGCTYALTDARIHAFTARDSVAANTQQRVVPSNVLDKGVAFFLSCSIELPHHARFFRNFFGRTMEEMRNTTFEKSCDGSAE